MELKHFYVEVPITGTVAIDVLAFDEEDALEEAFDKATLDNIIEWDMYEENVFNGIVHQSYVEEVDK